MNSESLIIEAESFLSLCYQELGKEQEINARMEEIREDIIQTGTYEHTFDELVHGAKIASEQMGFLSESCFFFITETRRA